MNIKKRLSFKKLTIFSCLCLSLNVISQSLDDEFINSLPADVRDDLLSNINTEDNAIQQSKDYDSFSSLVPKTDSLETSDSLKRFGDEFFYNMPSTFMPINDPSASLGYILDVDDILFIQLIGDRSEEYEYKIDRGGNISIPDVGFIKLAGLSLESANTLLNETLNEYFVETQAIISLKEIRDINILITGHVSKPGFYILSGYSSIIHAIIAAGGISENGSFRNVVVKRNGETIYNFDLYQVFIYGDTSSSISLRSGDSIVVNSSNNFIPLIGAFNREAIYEFIDTDTIKDLINYAGGISSNANLDDEFTLVSNDNGNLTVTVDKILNAGNFLPKENDKLFISYKDYESDEMFISDEEDFIENPIIVSGAVKFPGKYYINQNDNLSNLISMFGGFKKDAYVFGAALFNEDAMKLEKEFNSRLYNDAIKSLANLGSVSRTENLVSITNLLDEFKNIEPQGRIVTEFSLEKLKEDPNMDYRLSPGDKIHVPYFKKVIYIFGEVLNPGTLIFKSENTLEDYINKSGGFNEYADKSSIIIIHPNGESQRIKLKTFASSSKYELFSGSVIYVPRDLKQIDGIELGSVMAPIISSLAISLASLNSISNN